MKHNPQDLIVLFNQLFEKEYKTRLVSGGNEPIYLPANSIHSTHRIIFANNYFASALHEIAHWCIASENRRLLQDYGYWYQPDGRDHETQIEFEKVEIKPQALEWILSVSCNFPFQVSCDNLGAMIEPDRKGFKEKIKQQVLHYLTYGMPLRAKILSNKLCLFYKQNFVQIDDFLDDNKDN